MSVGAVNKQTGDRIPTAGMPAIDDALDLTSVNPVQNAVITAALALKQDKTDNSLQTTDKTVVGAINEHEGDISSLKSGLTNVADDVKLNTQDLTTPSRTKNLLPLTVDGIKAANTDGTWSGNAYTINGITFTVLTDNGNVSGIKINGTASADLFYFKISEITISNTKIFSNGNIYSWNVDGKVCEMNNGAGGVYRPSVYNGVDVPAGSYSCWIAIKSGTTINNEIWYPMLRSPEENSTFAPYIPSVESRIEAVESNLLYLGKGAHDFKRTVYCGYISGSGNYVDFFVPCKYDSTISTVALNSSALMSIYTFNGTLLTQSDIDFTVVSLEKAIDGLKIELKFSDTQTAYINTIVNIALGYNSVFTFS